jgi:hypothetical protein
MGFSYFQKMRGAQPLRLRGGLFIFDTATSDLLKARLNRPPSSGGPQVRCHGARFSRLQSRLAAGWPGWAVFGNISDTGEAPAKRPASVCVRGLVWDCAMVPNIHQPRPPVRRYSKRRGSCVLLVSSDLREQVCDPAAKAG